MSYFGNSLTQDAKDTEEAITAMHAAEERAAEANATGNAELGMRRQ
jgi:hypothetical protein